MNYLKRVRSEARKPHVIVSKHTIRRRALRRLGVLSKGDLVLWSGDARVPPPLPEDYLGKIVRLDHMGWALVEFTSLRIQGNGYVAGAPTDTVKIWVLVKSLYGARLDD